MAKGSVSKMLPQHASALATLAEGEWPRGNGRILMTLRRWGCYTTERTDIREFTHTITAEGIRLLAAYEAKYGPEKRAPKARTFAPVATVF
jgi:hypothetical protein